MPTEIQSGDQILRDLFAFDYSASILETIDSRPVMPRAAVMIGIAFPFGMCDNIVSSIYMYMI